MNSDTTSNVYDFLYREYSNQGRWSSPDPAGLAAIDMLNPQSWNRYAFVGNNPCAAIDPLGLATCTFSISVKNNIGLNTPDLVDALTQIADIFSRTPTEMETW